LSAIVLVLAGPTWAAQTVPSPKEVVGLDVGQDRVLASYTESVKYLRALAAASDRVRVLEAGPTVEGRTMVAAVVSSAENIARLPQLRAGWARLADPRGLDAPARDRLLATLPSCALITAGIHSTEVAGPQAALLFAHRLAIAPEGSREAQWLAKAVVLIVPSLNPDGQDAVVAWYRKWLGTPYEGSNPPFLYHRYAGHDNNRDFVYLTQPESRALNRLAYHDWHPQLFLDLHMMGSTGPRQFVPPFADPIAPHLHPLVWRITSHLGTLMSLRLEENGRTGVISGWTFDGNWIGGTRNTGWWKNVFGVLTETASAALATPIQIDEGELRGGGKGLTDYRQQVNFPNPWPGGRWGLPEAVGYQLDIMAALVEFAAVEREAVLRDSSAMAAEAVAMGERGEPHAYLVPPGPDPGRWRHLVELLLTAGVEGFVAPDGVSADGLTYPPGTAVFPTAQPLRQYLVDVMERQHYPEIAPAPDAEILLPYDLTGWTMPLELGVSVMRAEAAPVGKLTALTGAAPQTGEPVIGDGPWFIVPAGQLGGFAAANDALARRDSAYRLTSASGRFAAGSFVLGNLPRAEAARLARETGVTLAAATELPPGARALQPVRIALYQPYFGLEDGGWLRFVLERAGYTVTVVDSAAVAGDKLPEGTRVLVLPAMDAKVLLEGPRALGAVSPPPEYRRGLGRDGAETVKRFFHGGGTVLAFGGSAEWLAEALELPATNVLRGVGREEFNAPGALVELAVDTQSLIGLGMSGRVAAMVEWASAFQTRPVAGEVSRVVAAHFPDEALVLSGWVRGEEKLRRRAAVVEAKRGAGRAVLYAFPPHFRGQTEATFPLIFNAVEAAMMDAPAGAAGKAN
jgi:hypothetical protein